MTFFLEGTTNAEAMRIADCDRIVTGGIVQDVPKTSKTGLVLVRVK
jgi:hypothetical protein